MKRTTKMLVLLMLLICTPPVHGQNPAFDNANDPANANAQNNIFYFDSNSDCNSPIRDLYGFEATIKGSDISTTRLGPTTCTIRLRSTSQFDGTVLDIEVKAMNILDCTTQVAIYDGDGAQLLLMSYDCRSSQNLNKRRFLTSGDTATFIMSRQNVNNVQFDIEIKIYPTRAGQEPGYENDFGTNFYFDKFPQESIVGMIGGFYALICMICSIIIIFSIRSFRGLNKEWEIHQLATIKTGTAFEMKSQPSQVWSMGNSQSRGPNSQYSRTMPGPLPYKSRPPPSEDGDSDDAFQKRRLMNEEKERARPRYVSNNASFTEPEDDPDHFVEKVITPRVRTGNTRNRRPPSYEEAISDHPSEHSSEEESDVSSSDYSTKKRPLSSEGSRSSRSRSSRSRTPSETESEEESESDDGRSSRDRGARARRHKAKPHKNRRKDSRDEAGPSHSNRPQQQQPPPPQMQPVPYGAYPPGQFVPVMAGPQFQPVPMVPAYPPPGYPQEPRGAAAAEPRGQQVQPTDPPVYSYLVRRGYTPLDERSNSHASSAGSHRSGGARLEEPDMPLDSGIEYMRR